jgi:hypothetical protein
MGEVRLIVPRLRLIKGRYFWRPTAAVKGLGFAAEALGRDMDLAIGRARELNALVEAARRGETAPAQPTRETLAALIVHYRKSPKWKRLAPKTREGYDGILNKIEAKAGQIGVRRGITRKGLAQVYDDLLELGLATAAAYMRVWRILMGHAYDIGWRDDNPAKGLHIVTPPARTAVWTADEVKAFCKTATDQKRASLAFAVRLALDIAQRRGDLLALNKTHWDGAGFTIKQAKTCVEIYLPVSDQQLRAEIEAAFRERLYLLVSETTGRPWKGFHFAHEFARIRALAGVSSKKQFRDMRRTSATELGDSGATETEIRAVTGHLSPETVKIYVRPNRATAQAAQRKRRRARAK